MKPHITCANARVQTSPPHENHTQHSHRCSRLLLTAVSAICSSRSLPDPLATTISSFVTSKKHWSIESASELGNRDLLESVTALDFSNAHPLYCTYVCSRAVVHAVKHENAVELLNMLSDCCPDDGLAVTVLAMTEAASLGKIHVLEWFHTNHEPVIWCSTFAFAAAAAGHLAVLQWLKTHYPEDQ